MSDSKVQTGLRIPQDRYEELAALAKRMGISFNALALMLIDVGVSAVNLGIEAAAHSDLHIPQRIGEQCTP